MMQQLLQRILARDCEPFEFSNGGVFELQARQVFEQSLPLYPTVIEQSSIVFVGVH